MVMRICLKTIIMKRNPSAATDGKLSKQIININTIKTEAGKIYMRER